MVKTANIQYYTVRDYSIIHYQSIIAVIKQKLLKLGLNYLQLNLLF